MKCEFYKKKFHRFKSLLDQWGQLLGSLFTDGFAHGGEVWKVAVLGITGDALSYVKPECTTGRSQT